MAENLRHRARRIAPAVAGRGCGGVAGRKPHRRRHIPSPPEANLLRSFFTPAQHALVEELSETIIPADSHSGGAKAAKVADYIEQELRESTDDNRTSTWREGLRLVDLMSQHYHGKSFVDSSSRRTNCSAHGPFRQRSNDRSSRGPVFPRTETPDRSWLLHIQDRHSRRTGIQGQSASVGICRLRRSRAQVFIIECKCSQTRST